MTHIRISGLYKRFRAPGSSVAALNGIDLTIPHGRITSVVGIRGSGKSTLLRIVAGLDRQSAGQVEMDDGAIGGPSRDRAMVFADPRLLPWLSVEQNVALALHGVPRRQARDRVAHCLDLTGLTAVATAYPHQLADGMAQRAAIARALAARPAVLLLDEPFAALDALTRMVLQQDLLRIWEAERLTMVLATHDIDEAVFLADQVVVMSARPGTVRAIVPVPLERPRDRAGPMFVTTRQVIHREFFHQVEPPFAYTI